mgnify:CR=1 FL=1
MFQALTNPRILRILLAVGALGFIVSHPLLLGWLARQAPIYAFGLWYVIFFAFITFVGITLLPGRFRLRHVIGVLVLWFGLSPVLGYVDSPELSQKITGEIVTGVAGSPEETILAYFWELFTRDTGTLIFLVYILTPVLLVALAVVILRPGPFVNFFKRVVHL